MKRHFTLPAGLSAALLLASSFQGHSQTATAAAASSPPAYASDPAFQSVLEQARQTDDPEHGHFDHWKAASELAKGQCMDCLRHVISGEFAARQWNEAIASSLLMDTNAVNAEDRFYAEASAGKALLHTENGQGVPPSTQLSQAEGYFRSAIALHPRAYALIYTEGEILATLGRNDEARSMFERYLRFAPETDTRRERAQQFLSNPQLASRLAPGAGAAATAQSTAQVQAPASSSAASLSITSTSASTKPTAAQQPPAPEPAYKSDPKFQKAYAAAQERVPQDEKLARWKKASKLADNHCLDCLRAIITLQMAQEQWKDAVNSCNQMDAVSTEKKDKFFAAAERGEALMHSDSGQVKPDQVRLAEASFHTALDISPRTKTLVFKEGRALALLGRDSDAKAMFERYLTLAGEADPYRIRAEHFIENPHLASFPMAPPFTVTTAEGEQISLDEQVGKVVLLDFWATWCGPCKQTLPEIHSIAKKFAGQPLVVVSISSDSDDVAWKDFIAKNDMFWAQYRDANHALSNAYGVSAIPRFFTIDSDGVLQSVKVGSGADIEGDLKKLIKRASEAEKKKAVTSDKRAAE